MICFEQVTQAIASHRRAPCVRMQPVEITTDWNVTALKDTRLQSIRDYWLQKHLFGRVPARKDIEPTELQSVLPHVFLIDVLEQPRDFRFRLAGTHFRQFAGMEVTGKSIAQVFPPKFCAEVRFHWSAAVDRAAPIIGAGKVWSADYNFMTWEGIVMPLSQDGERIDMLFGGFAVQPISRCSLSSDSL